MLDRHVRVHEVLFRDGLQNERNVLSTDQKLQLIEDLSSSGLHGIEVTCFTSSIQVPAFNDADEVMRNIKRNPRVQYSASVSDTRSLDRAMNFCPNELKFHVSLSESHNVLRAGRRLSLLREDVTTMLRDVQDSAKTNVVVSTAFGCPVEGTTNFDLLVNLCDEFIELGVSSLTLCDTSGLANPMQVADLSSEFIARWPNTELRLHLRNTRGMALANAVAGLTCGVDNYCASLGGAGRCNYVAGAPGTVATEDLTYMFTAMRISTGIDLDKLLSCASQLPEMLGHDVSGALLRAGVSRGRNMVTDK